MSSSTLTGVSPLCVPENILKRIFELTNQIRSQYKSPQVQFSKELSFIAGEHACNMSTKMVPFSHEGIQKRRALAPLAISFTENIALVTDTNDPGKDTVFQWISKSSSFSRMLANFTHTGVGCAESEDGGWYCTQVFATYKTRLTNKDRLLLTMRYVNRLRGERNLPGLTPSIAATAKLLFISKENSEALLSITPLSAKCMFQNCQEADFIADTFKEGDGDPLVQFFQMLRDSSEYLKFISREATDISFVMRRIAGGKVCFCLVLGKCTLAYRKIPSHHMSHPVSFRMMQLVNDYRAAHNKPPFQMTHQWCYVAEKHTISIMSRQGEIEVKSVIKRIEKQMPGSAVDCGAYILPLTHDPLRELMLMWISSSKSKALLLSDRNNFAFGLSLSESKFCYATRIIGDKPNAYTYNDSLIDEYGEIQSSDLVSQILPMTSESDVEDSDDELLDSDASTSFRLTG